MSKWFFARMAFEADCALANGGEMRTSHRHIFGITQYRLRCIYEDDYYIRGLGLYRDERA